MHKLTQGSYTTKKKLPAEATVNNSRIIVGPKAAPENVIKSLKTNRVLLIRIYS